MSGKPTVVFLHGSGDTGPGIRAGLKQIGFLKALESAGVHVETPSAKPIPYRLAGNQLSSVWFDRYDLPPTSKEHIESVENSCAQLEALVDQIVSSGTPADRIVVGGFSMGGGISLQYGFRSKHKLAGVFALSSYVTNEAAVYKLIGKKAKEELPPVYMRHGAADDFILPTWGQGTSEQLASLGVDINFSLIPRLPHSLSPSELDELQQWLQERLALTS